MRPSLCLLLSALIFPGYAPVKGDDRSLTEGIKLELMALEARMKLRSGRVTLREVTTVGPLHRPPDAAVDYTYEMEFNGEQMRVRRTNNEIDRAEIRIFTGDEYIHDPAVRDPGTGDYLRIVSRSVVEEKSLKGGLTDDLFHPRILGCYPTTVVALDNFTIEDSLAQTDRINEVVQQEELDGHQVQHISYQRSNTALVDLWIAPEMDHAVLQIKAAGESSWQTVHSEYTQPVNGLWYPQKVVAQRYQNDKLVQEQTTTIEFAEFNVPIDPHLFALQSLDLQPGEQIRHDGRMMIWDGRKLISIQEAGARSIEQLLHPEQSWLTVFWTLLAGLFGCLAFYTLWRRRKVESLS